ncbi:MAG: hypothetical protein FWE42_05465 [Defluviitaleaceae bacterium]|nr:hypothetical protein [Defluviitaleaceae bacterium]
MNPIINKINEIDWPAININFNWTTEIYGNAENIGASLRDLFSGDIDLAMEATHYLWCNLCHQHSYISSAALPAYDFLIVGLKEFEEKLKVELLDIFLGFAVCTMHVFFSDNKCDLQQWEVRLYHKMANDIEKFRKFTHSSNEDIAYFSNEIVSYITKGHSHWSPPEDSEFYHKIDYNEFFKNAIQNPNLDVKINRVIREGSE